MPDQRSSWFDEKSARFRKTAHGLILAAPVVAALALPWPLAIVGIAVVAAVIAAHQWRHNGECKLGDDGPLINCARRLACGPPRCAAVVTFVGLLGPFGLLAFATRDETIAAQFWDAVF